MTVKYVVPLWLVASVLLCSVASAVVTYYVWQSVTIPFRVQEPIEIISYPNELSLLPGETKQFNVTVNNHASMNYSVVLNFYLSNITYQNMYVTFSNETYTVISGQQILSSQVSVESYAPSTSMSLNIDFIRSDTNQAGIDLQKDAVNWLTGPPEKIVVYVRNRGISDATIDAVYVGTSNTNLVLQTSVTYDPPSKAVPKEGGTVTIMFDYNWTSQTTHYFRIVPRIGEPLPFQEQAS
jgi:hypothetical protein